MGQISPAAQRSGDADDVERAKRGGRRRPIRSIAIVIPLIAFVVAAGLIIVARRPSEPLATVGPAANTVGPAANGLIAYSSDGDIFVGDPVTGASKAITSGPESDINPKFSPDGTHIAFVRGTKIGALASLVIVRSDGSDERVVVAEDFSQRGIYGFAWAPDGIDILVEVDFPPITYPHGDGELGLFDASGVREPRLIVPPLTAWIGGVPFNPSAQVAPMFQPPDGDLILSQGTLTVFDADFTGERQLSGEWLADYGPEGVFDPTWSPDGTAIVVSRGYDNEVTVLNAEGAVLYRLGAGSWPTWSPDSSTIAFEDVGPGWPEDQDRLGEVRIAVHDLASGIKRVLASSVSPLKQGATVQTITNNVMHTWYYEGWSWSPDGRSLLLLKDHRTRPIVVDIATDTATELPWETDSFPSWQRVVVP